MALTKTVTLDIATAVDVGQPAECQQGTVLLCAGFDHVLAAYNYLMLQMWIRGAR
jgi:hypothetical protein